MARGWFLSVSWNFTLLLTFSVCLLAQLGYGGLCKQSRNLVSRCHCRMVSSGNITTTNNAGTCFGMIRHFGSRSGRRKFLNSRIGYHANTDARFQLERLRTSGDINPNPGPTATHNKDSTTECSVCNKTVSRHHRTMKCAICNLWCHKKCGGIKSAEYKRRNLREDTPWTCPVCTHQQMFPFANMNILDASLDEKHDSTQNHLDNMGQEQEVTQELSQLEKERIHSSKDLLLCHLNINSIQNKFEELRDIIKELRIQIMVVGETKIDSSYPDSQFRIPGYSLHRNDRAKGGGGILAFVSSRLQCHRLKLGKKYKTLEPIALQISLRSNDMIILGIYRPPTSISGPYQVLLEEELSHICNWAALQRHTVVVIGDLNLDRLRPDKVGGKLLMHLEEEQGFNCLINEPTRIQIRSSVTTRTLIDVLLTNKPEIFKSSGVYNPELSDHAVIYGIIKEKVKHHHGKVITFRSKKHFDPEKFKEHLNSAPWHVGEIFDCIDDQAGFWSSLMSEILDEHLPPTKMRVREHDVPYMTTEWKQKIRAKRKAAKRYDKCNTKENWELKRKLRNDATRLRRKAIREYWRKKSNDLNSNPRLFYKTFMPFLGRKKYDQNSEICLDVNGRMIKDQGKVAETFGNYFATIADGIGGQDVRTGLTEQAFENHPSTQAIARTTDTNSLSFDFQQLNITAVEKALSDLNPNKATGWDFIQTWILKIGGKELSLPLTTLYNSCIRNASWPTEWKKGEWVPVFKKDNAHDKTNYRPITIQLGVNKVFEQLLTQQITKRFDNRLSDSLTAYRKRHSCETALIMLTEHWRAAIDKGEIVGLLSTDMSKAFDSLHHPLLLAKLKAYGFNGTALDLLRSYLSNRSSRTKLKNAVSSWKQTNRGCPQGSAFGPLLWNIFQNDLVHEITSSLCMYADDHQFYISHKCTDTVKNALQANAKAASEWYTKNYLKGNYSKYRTMTMGKQNETVNINVEGSMIESCENLKLYGVNIDRELRFTEHISNVCKKSSQRVGVIMRLRNLIPIGAKIQLYKAAILPHLTYCHTVWHFCRASDTRKLERIQERALRAIYCDKQSTYQQLLERAKLPTLQNRRLQDIAVIMFKVKHNLCPKYISNLFEYPDSHYNLRNKDFSTPRIETVTYGKHSLRFLGPKLWSKLNKATKSLSSLGAFKHSIRQQDLVNLVSNDCINCILCKS